MLNDFLEMDLEDIIFDNLDKIETRGFPKLYKNTERQFLLPDGRKMDIISWEVVDNVFYGKIIELKKDTLTEAAFGQGCGYYFEVMCAMAGNFKNSFIELVLIGKSFQNSLISASILSEYIKIYTYKYGWDGISFECASHGRSFIRDNFYNGKSINGYDYMVKEFKRDV